MELGAFFTLVLNHWQSIAIVSGAGVGLWQAVQKKAYQQFFLICLDLVRQVAVEELSGKEKREKVVKTAYENLPLWAKKLITEQKANELAEQAYQLLRGEIKAKESATE